MLSVEQHKYVIKVNLKDHTAFFLVITQCVLTDVKNHFYTDGRGSTFP